MGDRYVPRAECSRAATPLGGEQSGHVIDTVAFATTGDGALHRPDPCAARSSSAPARALAELAAGDVVTRSCRRPSSTCQNVDKECRLHQQDACRTPWPPRRRNCWASSRPCSRRASGTEPLVRVMAEAATQAYADEVCTRLAKIVAEELAL